MGVADRTRTLALTVHTRGMAKKTIEHAAEKGQFLTLDELAAWVQDAMRAGVDGGTVVRAVVSFGGKLQKVSVQTEAPSQVRDDIH